MIYSAVSLPDNYKYYNIKDVKRGEGKQPFSKLSKIKPSSRADSLPTWDTREQQSTLSRDTEAMLQPDLPSWLIDLTMLLIMLHTMDLTMDLDPS